MKKQYIAWIFLLVVIIAISFIIYAQFAALTKPTAAKATAATAPVVDTAIYDAAILAGYTVPQATWLQNNPSSHVPPAGV